MDNYRRQLNCTQIKLCALLSALIFIGELVLLHLGQIGFTAWADRKATHGSAIAGD
jgi:hypothetical protein